MSRSVGSLSSLRWLLLVPTAAVSVACTPGVHTVGSGGGGSGATGTGTTSGSTTSVVSSTTTQVSTATTSTMSSTSSGMSNELQLYQHAYPFNTVGAVWTKSPITAVLGPDAPTQNIISAVKLQNMDVLYLVTSDEIVHYLHAGAWATKPINTMFPIPAGTKQDTTNPCNPANPMGPPAVAVSTDPATYIFHLPAGEGNCGPSNTGESVTLLGKTYGTDFDIQPDFTGKFGVQRPYHTDCYPDDYGPTEYALWGLNWANPTQCGISNWFITYAWYNNHVLREAGGTSNGPWTATDPNNPIFKTPAPQNQPDPDKIVGAYFVQDANPTTGTAVFIAP
jgi:hypothetical protein